MTIVIVVLCSLVLGLAIALTVVLIGRKENAHEREHVKSLPVLISVQVPILCADCAGSEAFPRKTYQTTRGTCSDCGGTAFVLTSDLRRSRPTIREITSSRVLEYKTKKGRK